MAETETSLLFTVSETVWVILLPSAAEAVMTAVPTEAPVATPVAGSIAAIVGAELVHVRLIGAGGRHGSGKRQGSAHAYRGVEGSDGDGRGAYRDMNYNRFFDIASVFGKRGNGD